GQHHVRGERRKLCHKCSLALGVYCTEAIIDPQIAAHRPAQFLQLLHERGHASESLRIVRSEAREPTEATHRSVLLRQCADRPRRSAAEKGDELAALNHSITSSARANTVARTSMPSARAVLRLITNSYLVGACTGRSA